MSRRWLVTGGAGFIGSALVRRLVAEKTEVRVLDDASRGRPSRLADLADQVQLIEGDVRDADAVDRAVAGVDGICHLAAINGTEFFYSVPYKVLDVGIKGTLNVIEAARRHRVERLVVFSSSEVYQTPPRIPTDETVPFSIPDPLNPRYSYAGSKIASELLALNYGREPSAHVIVIRPHNVYGPDMGWEHVIPQLTLRLNKLRTHSNALVDLPIEGTGEETRAFAYIEDAIDGVMAAIEHGANRDILNVGVDIETRIDTLAIEVGRIAGCAVRVIPGASKAGATKRRCPDLTKLKALGFSPRVPLEEGLRVTVGWYLAHASEH